MRKSGWSYFFRTFLLLFLPVMLVGGPAFAGTGFSDLSADHWAGRYVAKMSALGIVGGYGDGTFRPDRIVTQEEAVVMAARSMGEYGGGYTDIPATVSPWAEKGVAGALGVGLLESDDVFVPQAGATRAWVTRLLVRMIGKDNEAAGPPAMPGFTDSYKIPDWALGYVKVAQEYKLVSGYSDDTFRPQRAVTRAELAVFLGRAMEYLDPPEEIVDGRVLTVGTGTLTVNTGGGGMLSLEVPAGTPLYGDDGQMVLTDLQRYDRVSLVAEDGVVKFLEKTAAVPASQVVVGILRQVYPAEGMLVVEVPGGSLRNLYLPENAGVSMYGAGQGGLSALQRGDEVEVTLNSQGLISGITVTSRSAETVNEGVIFDLDTEADLLIIQSDSGQKQSYNLGDQITVTAEGYRFPTLEDVREGDRVRLEVENGTVVGMEILEVSALADVTGTVKMISAADRLLTLETGEGTFETNPVASNAEIEISGLDAPSLDDIVVGDEVEARIENGEFVKLQIKGRQVENKLSGTVAAVDTANDILVFRDSDDELHEYELKDSARVLIDGEEGSLGDVNKDTRVTVRLADGEIFLLEVDNSLEGTVADLDEEALILVFKDINGKEETYAVDKNVDVDSEDSRNELDEIRRGDYAEITVNDDETVTDIMLRTEKVLRVERIRESWDRIDAEDEDGDTDRLRIEGGVELVVPGIDYPDVEDVEEGDMVKAVFMGHDLERVEVLEPRRGEIVSLSTYSQSVTVQSFDDGNAFTLEFDDNCRIIEDDNEYDDMDRLSRGDRVEVLENADGGYDFKVMEKIRGTLAFDGDEEDGEIYLDDSYSGWDDYDLASGVYVHDSGDSISARDLKKGDAVNLYLLNDLVYEIEL